MLNQLLNGQLTGQVQGDITVNIQLEPQSLLWLFLLIVASVLFSLLAAKMIK
jgi:hypothetical protein